MAPRSILFLIQSVYYLLVSQGLKKKMILLILVSKLSYICCEITHTEKNVAKIDGKYQKGFFL